MKTTGIKELSNWDRLPGGKSTLLKDFPIPTDWADPCIQRYRQIYADPETNWAIIKGAYSYSMDFKSNNISAWVDDIVSNTNVAEIKVCLGMYTGDILKYYVLPEDRLTVFLYPFDSNGVLAVYTKDSTYSPPLPGSVGIGASRTMSPASTGDSAMAYNFAGLEPS